MNFPSVSSLYLKNFRNFFSKKINFCAPQILLCGPNGVGKTNILESLSLTGKNSSLRGSENEEMLNCDSTDFSIYSEIANHEFIEKVATSYSKITKKRTFEINGESINSKRQSDLKSHLINFIFLTPQIEQLFILGKSERRSYLDKIVCDIDNKHQTRINNYQKSLKERLLILQKYRGQATGNKWLEIIENNIVELGIAIAFARIETTEFFNKAIVSMSSSFPKTNLRIFGEVENALMKESSLKIENLYRDKLKQNRQSDLENFKTSFGVHRTDFDAVFIDKNTSAILSSTGEQKAIMLSTTLARAIISSSYKNQPTILIFDEIVSHLDEKRKKHLFEEIKAISLQSFFTATSSSLIPSEFVDKIQIYNLS